MLYCSTIGMRVYLVVAMLAIIGLLSYVNACTLGLAQNQTTNFTKPHTNISNSTLNNPFLSGRTPFGSAALP
jgi:hypothetical protein